jgi:hypothetical protein
MKTYIQFNKKYNYNSFTKLNKKVFKIILAYETFALI